MSLKDTFHHRQEVVPHKLVPLCSPQPKQRYPRALWQRGQSKNISFFIKIGSDWHCDPQAQPITFTDTKTKRQHSPYVTPTPKSWRPAGYPPRVLYRQDSQRPLRDADKLWVTRGAEAFWPPSCEVCWKPLSLHSKSYQGSLEEQTEGCCPAVPIIDLPRPQRLRSGCC